MKGAFTLQTPHDLFSKLEYDFEALSQDRNNPYLAYNFFVTAEHMLDWVYPGYTNKNKRQSERDSQILLQICSHLASGAKHFVAEAKHHNTVSNPGRKRCWNPLGGPLDSPLLNPFGISVLCVNLDGEAKEVFGRSIKVLDLAKLLLDYWQKHEMLTDAVT